MVRTLATAIVAINAAIWMGFGPAFYFWPEAIGEHLGISLQSPTALADFRAMYGGAPLGVGVFMAIGLRRAEWFKPALMVVILGTGGILLGRLISVAHDPGIEAFQWAFIGLEVIMLAVAIWAYRNLEATPGS
jgi:hypothetical protein